MRGAQRALTCSAWSLLPGADRIWYLLELLSSPLLLSQRTVGMGSPQTTARKRAFLPGWGRVTVRY